MTSEWLMIKIAPIVITALLLNPLTASSGVRILNKSKMPVTPIAVTSSGILSATNSITAINKTENNIKISKEIIFPI